MSYGQKMQSFASTASSNFQFGPNSIRQRFMFIKATTHVVEAIEICDHPSRDFSTMIPALSFIHVPLNVKFRIFSNGGLCKHKPAASYRQPK